MLFALTMDSIVTPKSERNIEQRVAGFDGVVSDPRACQRTGLNGRPRRQWHRRIRGRGNENRLPGTDQVWD